MKKYTYETLHSAGPLDALEMNAIAVRGYRLVFVHSYNLPGPGSGFAYTFEREESETVTLK